MPTGWGYGADGLRLGLGKVKGVDRQQGTRLLAARSAGGKFSGLGGSAGRVRAFPVHSGELVPLRGLDRLPDVSGRREALWRIGAGYQVGVGPGAIGSTWWGRCGSGRAERLGAG